MAEILVIDDDEAIRESLAIMLRRRGHEVVTAENGADGFARFAEHRPPIVISDLIMPGDDGIVTIGRIRQVDPDVKIIAMSGSSIGNPGGCFAQAKKAGADICLEKPFDPSELFDALGRAWEADGAGG